MKKIPLTKGYVALVDDEDYERVAIHKWCAAFRSSKDGGVKVYAKRSVRKPGGIQKSLYLHRTIMNAPDGIEVDHINGDPLDNQRSNMRMCTHAENLRNQRPQTGGTSKHRGVSWCKRDARWQVHIKVNGKRLYLGNFTDEDDAARAYDAAAVQHFGEFYHTHCHTVRGVS